MIARRAAFADVLAGQVTMMFAGISSIKQHANVGRLSEAMARTVRLPDVSQRLVDLGFDPIGSAPEQYVANIRSETAKWARVIRQAGVRLD